MRFSTPYIGSSAIAGKFDAEHPRTARRARRNRLADVMRAAGLDPKVIPALARAPQDLLGYLEVHIEQGPVLLHENLPVGIVTCDRQLGAAAREHHRRRGSCRNGADGARVATPPLPPPNSCSMWSDAVPRRRRSWAPSGELYVPGGAINVIPGRCELTSTSAPTTTRRAMPRYRTCLREIERIAERRGVAIEVKEIARGHNVPCSPRIQRLLAEAVTRAGIAVRSLPSGAGHDAMHVRRRHRTRHAVRALRQRRHQPFTRWKPLRRGRRSRGAHSPGPIDELRASGMTIADQSALSSIASLRARSRSSPNSSKCRATIRPATARRMPRARRRCWRQLGLSVEAHPVPRSIVEAAGMKSATNLIVRHRFGDGPDGRAQCARRCRAAGTRMDARSLWRRGRRRAAWQGHVRAWCRGVEVRFCDLHICAAGFEGRRRERRKARRHGRAAFHL